MVPMSAELEALHVISILHLASDYTDEYKCTEATYFTTAKYILEFRDPEENFTELKDALYRYGHHFHIKMDYSLDTRSFCILLHHRHDFLEYM